MTLLEQFKVLFNERKLVDLKFYVGPTDRVVLPADITQELSRMLKAAEDVTPSLKFDEGEGGPTSAQSS